jgi:2-amino-4-hydroxy-6-hydroxymethyldihydropteridine diphosphokinase
LEEALRLLSRIRGSRLIARSAWYETTPVGGPAGQANFLNGAVLLDSQPPPHQLVAELRRIETSLGRDRAERWAARTLDLDLLLYGEAMLEEADLEIPHPRMVCRQFVLQPARQIAGQMVHPPSGWTVAALAEHLCRSTRRVTVIAAHPAVSQWLADELCRILEAPRQEECPSAADLRSRSRLEWEKQTTPVGRIPPVIGACPIAEGIRPDLRTTDSVFQLALPALVLAVEGDSENLLKQHPIEGTLGPVMSPATFRQFVRQCRGMPILRITSSDPQQVVEEALAAVAAAWPD